jgi:putative FmdB family regulatory protein
MPTYVYSCEKCGDFEQFRYITDDMSVNPVCPDCSSIDVARVFLAPGIAFKGSGFYSTDKK